MLNPDLRLLTQWLDPALVSGLEGRRRLKKSGTVAASWQLWKRCG